MDTLPPNVPILSCGQLRLLQSGFPCAEASCSLRTSLCEMKCQQIKIKNICRWLLFDGLGLQAIIQGLICLSLSTRSWIPTRSCTWLSLGSLVVCVINQHSGLQLTRACATSCSKRHFGNAPVIPLQSDRCHFMGIIFKFICDNTAANSQVSY